MKSNVGKVSRKEEPSAIPMANLKSSLDQADSLFFFGDTLNARQIYQSLEAQYKFDPSKLGIIKNSRLWMRMEVADDTNHTQNDSDTATYSHNQRLMKARRLRQRGEKSEVLMLLHELRTAVVDKATHAKVYYELGSYFRENQFNFDSALYYHKISLGLSSSVVLRAQNLCRLAELNLTHRDFVSAINYAEQAFELTLNSKNERFLTKLHRIKSFVFRKQGKVAESMAYIRRQLRLWDYNDHFNRAILLEELFYGHLYQAEFDQAELTITEIGHLDQQFVQVDRLMGFLYFFQDKHSEAIVHFLNSLASFKKQHSPDPVHIQQVFSMLTTSYVATSDFKNAQKYIYEGTVIGTRFEGSDFSWDTVLEDEVVNESHNFYNINKLVEISLKRTKSQPRVNVNELQQLLTVIHAIDSLTSAQVRVGEEEAFLEFAEIGKDIYDNAVETCRLLYQETAGLEYLRRFWHFAEKSKGLIL
ncbi:MAG: hypothetical protein AAFO69_09065, partial [Bacteroidota bacterium]